MSFTRHITKSLVAAACCTLTLGSAIAGSTASPVTADTYRLKTSIDDVNGVREIESGDYAKGIARSKAALAKTSVSGQRSPLHNNLCVAYVATGELDAAKQHCDAAVETSKNNVFALNNRAVMHCLTDNHSACIADLTWAQQKSKSQRIVKQNLSLAKQHDLLSKN
ncbi:tetratricopeptide repeat protein [Alteromonas gilva]|uniref:Tetratricopeptide repeat protein n=1 Tax=Alteromonas gilva TaxID=2987522 RepID=A0ABT5L0X5_9ALTE|nr:tetratricopeptide repeat protein [Alteromonas gilva]MDC8830684.1 tetratricopeptide repeat protein [Alteromonas gilva]